MPLPPPKKKVQISGPEGPKSGHRGYCLSDVLSRGRRLSQLRSVEGGADPRAVKEDAHAQGFTTLRGDEAQLATLMIWVLDEDETGLVGGGAVFEPCNALLDRAAKARADLEAVPGCRVLNHGVVPESAGEWLKEGVILAVSDGSEDGLPAPDYGQLETW
jgi:hypothetical protein